MSNTELKKFNPWTETECEQCHVDFLVSRADPVEVKEVICGYCKEYNRGFQDGIESAKDNWIPIEDTSQLKPNHQFKIKIGQSVYVGVWDYGHIYTCEESKRRAKENSYFMVLTGITYPRDLMHYDSEPNIKKFESMDVSYYQPLLELKK